MTIFQLILLATGVGSLAAWSFQDRTRELTWFESTLDYDAPDVPSSYDVNLPRLFSRWGFEYAKASRLLPGNKIETGQDLFLTSHRAGWNSYRYHFYSDFEVSESYRIKRSYNDMDLSDPDQIDSAAKLAYANGYNQCVQQVQDLLKTHSKDDLRRKIAQRKANSLSILLLAVFCLTGFILTLKSKWGWIRSVVSFARRRRGAEH